MIDDLGVKASVARPVQRVVSLVPSITEAIAMTCPHVLVGCTDYCIRPTHLEEIVGHEVVRVRGTKNPDRKAIIDLRPDLVVANREENREHDVTLLREAGVAVWVTRIDTVEEAISSLTRLFEEGFGVRCPQWLEEAGREWREPCRGEVLSAVTAVWRDPWICVGKDTYISDVLRRVGIELVDLPGESRYPHVELTDIAAAHPDRVILPDEPYHFGPDDVSAFPGLDVRLVDGQKLAWYGPSMVGARRYLASALR
ncbi:ABC transporter substrate-binding protein [Cutibacterium acnes]|uniref:helical backbone metal receptor n=1 Tax=Cutibacterium acnes TaxID=1747 RepID=UPI000C316F7F|nr:helical backbone metal receptor [Cutibacterium acnes]PKC26374.1 ABC transporter substrate-binding protein [Cutibacterium acnes]